MIYRCFYKLVIISINISAMDALNSHFADITGVSDLVYSYIIPKEKRKDFSGVCEYNATLCFLDIPIEMYVLEYTKTPECNKIIEQYKEKANKDFDALVYYTIYTVFLQIALKYNRTYIHDLIVTSSQTKNLTELTVLPHFFIVLPDAVKYKNTEIIDGIIGLGEK